MVHKKVLVVGGTGHFGNLLVEDLCRHTECDLFVPSRSVVDLRDIRSVDSALSEIFVAICAAGPFQTLPVTLAELCLRRGVHYIDLADDRGFVKKVHALVPGDGRDLPAICSGWSTVSAFSGALARIGTAGLDKVPSRPFFIRWVNSSVSAETATGTRCEVGRNRAGFPFRRRSVAVRDISSTCPIMNCSRRSLTHDESSSGLHRNWAG